MPQEQHTLCVCKDAACAVPFGLCHCGCRKETPRSNRARKERGLKKGDPTPYIMGHQGIDKSLIRDTGRFKLDYVYCRLIPLSRGLYAIVWESDYESLMQWKWHARFDPKHNTIYAARTVRTGKNHKMIYMHRQILGLEEGDLLEGDHVDSLTTLNNARTNLRFATRSQQLCNQRRRRDNTSGFKGVGFHPTSGLWYARIRINGVIHSLGYHHTPERAFAAYCEGARKYHGEFARF
jgi:AP2 domain